jgi:type II secretory pathway pseudopilin PulG
MKHNFTLVELLVTVGIIAILAGLVIPAVISSQNQGRITQAKSDMNAIKLALKSVETTYGKIINTGKALGSSTVSTSDDQLEINENTKEMYKAFIAELSDPNNIGLTNRNFNTRKIKFLDPSSDYDPTISYSATSQAEQWIDPWGKAYNIVIDLKFRGYVTINSKNRAGSFQIYSWGHDGVSQQGDNEDQNGGATDSDDIATWHK